MYFKLAFTNIKKSLKDYTIYFLTLTFSVCIFYVFNAIESQKAMMIVSETTDMMMQNLSRIIGYLSVFIAVVLGFLILYANKFLIRRRKKELGLYMILGMDKSKISFVLVLETFMIGLGSLISGLILGIFLSQGLSVFTAKIFGAQMEQFEFVFSKNGLKQSIGCFVVIYLTVMVFNVMTLSKCKLIDLIYAHKKSETPKVKSLWLSVILFSLAVVCLGVAYVFIIHNGLMAIDGYFYSAIALAFIGTFLFFMSLSGFMLKMVQCSKKVYEHELNMFIFRQINSKINTTYMSMTFICLMLAVTIVSLSSGMAMNQSMRGELKKLTPYDASFTLESSVNLPQTVPMDVQKVLEKMEIFPEEYASEFGKYEVYETPITFERLYEGQDMSKKSVILKDLKGRKLEAIALSDYNQALQMQELEPLKLVENEFAINCQQADLLGVVKTYLKTHDTLTYEGRTLQNKLGEPLQNTLYIQMTSDVKIILILPDEVINREVATVSVLNFNYKTPEMEQKLLEDVSLKEEQFEKMVTEEYIDLDGLALTEASMQINGLTKALVYDASVGLSAIMTFLTVYIALVFLLTSAAILALQQLTEAEDNKVRYQLLDKLGIDKQMVYKALFIQIAIYFAMPLLLAVVHGIVGIYVANQVIMTFGKISVLPNILFTAMMFILIYGAYFVGTYWSSKNVVK